MVDGSPADRAGLRAGGPDPGRGRHAGTRVEDLQRLMVADLIGVPVPVRLLRAGRTRSVELVPDELDSGDPMSAPTLYEWAGGPEALERLTEVFYDKVQRGRPARAGLPRHGPRAPAARGHWLAEVFGGPPRYTEEHGGYPHMLAKHRGLALTEEQRRRWVSLICDAADEAGLPADPEFRSAFVAYIEWGTRLALANSQPGADAAAEAPVPHWGWGEAPPYATRVSR